jgi:hypothetical protein
MNHYLRAAATAFLLIPVFLIAKPATEPNQPPSVQLPPELGRVLRDYEQAWSHGDASALAKLFADDGFVLSPGKPMVRGRAAVEEAYRENGGAPLALRAVAFATVRQGRLRHRSICGTCWRSGSRQIHPDVAAGIVGPLADRFRYG